MSRDPKISNAFQSFVEETPGHSGAWMQMVQSLGDASALDRKTEELAYIAVLSAARMEGGIPFHVAMAKREGATREEVASAVLVGLPAVGQVVIQCLPIALAAYDGE